MTEEALAEAAFWDEVVCLDCQTTFANLALTYCPSCASDAVYAAKFIQRCLEVVEHG